MITITNTGPTSYKEGANPDGLRWYRLEITRGGFAVVYQHRRSDGLAVCLRKAADAVEKRKAGE